MNKLAKRSITLASIMTLILLSNSVQAQDCTRYEIFDLRDTLVQNNPCVRFSMTIDTLLLNNSGYTSLFFVDNTGDTLNGVNWSYWIPDASIWDTVHYVLSYVAGVTGFPPNFDGHLMMRNPDCDIPFQFGTVGIEEQQEPEMILHPNPSNGWVRISTEQGAAAIDRVEVFDALGRRTLEVPFNDPSGIDCTELLPGSYIVRAWADEKPIFSQPVIIE